MASYRGTTDRPSQAKAISAVVAIHAALAFLILSGLKVPAVHNAEDRLKTFDLSKPPPPQPPPKPQPRESIKKAAGAPAPRAEPTPIVAPPPRIRSPSPLVPAKIAGAGLAPSSGAAASGIGNGAAGDGHGPGSAGTADFSRFTPAQRLSKIPDNQYRRLADTGTPYGSVAIMIRVTPDGRSTNCRVVRSSGDSVADELMCYLTHKYVRFRPALDPDGRPIAQDVTWTSNWSPH